MTHRRPKLPSKGGSRKRAGRETQGKLPQGIPPARSAPRPLSKHRIWIAASAAAVIVVAIGLGYRLLGGSGANVPGAAVATFVGSETCAGCHRDEAERWRVSQHNHAMDHATDKTVLGDFNDTGFDYYCAHSRFFVLRCV